MLFRHSARYKEYGRDDVYETEMRDTKPLTQYEIPATVKPNSNLITKIGWYGLLLLIPGTAIIAASLGIIIAFWISAQNGASSPFLRSVLLADWLARTITLASLVIRTILALQAALATAMIASLALERLEVPLAEVPQMLLMRMGNSPPYQFMYSMVNQGLPKASSLFFLFLATPLALCFVASQFMSTFLLSDLKPGLISSHNSTAPVYFGFSNNQFQEHFGPEVGHGVSYLTSSPSSYPSFAEYSSSGISSDSIDDTGMSIRAVLPFMNTDMRKSLRSYEGFTQVFNARALCGRPIIEDVRILAPPDDTRVIVTGTARFNQSHPKLKLSSGPSSTPFTYAVPFTCTVPSTSRKSDSVEWKSSMCVISPATNYDGLEADILSDDDLTQRVSWMLWNFTTTETKWTKIFNDSSAWNHNDKGPWLELRHPVYDVSIASTMCFYNAEIGYHNVTIHATSNRQEPELSWDSTRQNFNTSLVQKQLGNIKGLNHEDRGVMDMDLQVDWNSSIPPGSLDMAKPPGYEQLLGESYRNMVLQQNLTQGPTNLSLTMQQCFDCSYVPASGLLFVHQAHINIFQDVLRAAESPAKAVQAFFTILTLMSFYDLQPSYDVPSKSTYSTFVSVLLPRQNLGLVIVLATILLHIALISITTFMFITETRLGSLGDSWSAFTEGSTGEVAQVLRDVERTDSKVVNRVLKGQGKNLLPVGVATGSDGKVAVVRKAG